MAAPPKLQLSNGDIKIQESGITLGDIQVSCPGAYLEEGERQYRRPAFVLEDGHTYLLKEGEKAEHKRKADDDAADGGDNTSRVKRRKIGISVDVTDPKALLGFLRAKFSVDNKPTPLVSTYGAKFPLVNRKHTQAALWRWLKVHYAAWVLNKKDRNLHTLPVVAGCPGIGKSTVVDAAVELMASEAKRCRQKKWEPLANLLDNAVVISVTFSNGSSPNQEDIRIGADACLALRVLYRYFAERPGISFGDFRTLMGDVSKLTLHVALSCIKADREARGHVGNLLVYIGVDEFGKLLGIGADGNVDPNSPRYRAFLKGAVLAVGGCLCDPPHGVLLATLFAGTCFVPISKVIADSSHPRFDVPLPLLQLLHAEVVVESLGWPTSWKTCAAFRRCLSDVTRWGRALEIFLEIVSSVLSRTSTFEFASLDYVSIMEKTRSRLGKHYQLAGYAQYAKDIVTAVFLKKCISRASKLTWNDSTWGDLETMGAIALVDSSIGRGANDEEDEEDEGDVDDEEDADDEEDVDDKEDADDEEDVDDEEDAEIVANDLLAEVEEEPQLVVDLPFVLLRCILFEDDSGDLGCVEALLRSADGEDFWWQSWEKFHATYMSARAQLMIRSAYPTNDHDHLVTTVAELYQGALFSDSFSNKSIILPRKVSVASAQQRYPTTTLHPSSADSGEEIPFMRGDVVVINGKGAPFDVFTAWHAGDGKGTIHACDQLKKYESSSNRITLAVLRTEVQKTQDALLSAKIPDFTFGLFSDKQYDKTVDVQDLPDCLLVCRQNFRDFYGDLFADRAAFAAVQDKINVNTASWSLLQLVDGIGKARASKIITQRTQRPFASAEDMKARVCGLPSSVFDTVTF